MVSRLSVKVLGLVSAALITASMPTGGPSVAAATSEIRVGSFNVVGVNADSGAGGDRRTWKERRPVVASQILAQRLDVVGLQEVNQSSVYKSRLTYGVNQYLDLKGAINAKGGRYALTNSNAYNCVKPSSTYKCAYKDQNASGDNRILYNTNTISLVKQGATTFAAHASGKPNRYFAWAILQVKATGKSFFFSTTHLDPYSIPARLSQWNQLISVTNALKGSLPVVSTGDFNTSKFSDYASTYLPRMKSNGYGDVVNQTADKNTVNPARAENTYRAWVNSFNNFNRNVSVYGYEDNRNKIGNGIDWIFATNSVRVKGWEVVLKIGSNLRLSGVIPSDHALVRATLVL
jgi:endonuclease/exonuclease/phosphatase family metal-dependent hydrolase